MVVHRAGGHVDREDGKGWVVDDSPIPPPPKERPRKQLVTQGPDSGGWVLASPEPEEPVEPGSEPGSEPEQPVARKRGRPRKKA